MSRAPADTVIVKPSNNIYTALSGVALVVVILGLLAMWMKGQEVFPGGLFGEPPAALKSGR